MFGLVVRSALAFVARQERGASPAMLAAHAAFILATVILVNLFTVLGIATAAVPSVKHAVDRPANPIMATLGLVGLWGVAYALVRRVVRGDTRRGVALYGKGSWRPIVFYAIASVTAWIGSTFILAINQ